MLSIRPTSHAGIAGGTPSPVPLLCDSRSPALCTMIRSSGPVSCLCCEMLTLVTYHFLVFVQRALQVFSIFKTTDSTLWQCSTRNTLRYLTMCETRCADHAKRERSSRRLTDVHGHPLIQLQTKRLPTKLGGDDKNP